MKVITFYETNAEAQGFGGMAEVDAMLSYVPHTIVGSIEEASVAIINMDHDAEKKSALIKQCKQSTTVSVVIHSGFFSKSMAPLLSGNFNIYRFAANNPSRSIILCGNGGKYHMAGPMFHCIHKAYMNVTKKPVNNCVYIYIGGGSDGNRVRKQVVEALTCQTPGVNIIEPDSYDHKINRHLMDQCHYAITGGGLVSSECISVGLKQMIIPVGISQQMNALYLNSCGIVYVGSVPEIDKAIVKINAMPTVISGNMGVGIKDLIEKISVSEGKFRVETIH